MRWPLVDRTRHALTLVVLLGLALAGLTVGAGGAAAQKIKGDFWGMHDQDWVTAPTVPVGAANLTTSGTYWPSIEPAQGEFDWTRLDAQVEAARAIGAKPMLVLGKTPRFASTEPESADYSDHPPNLTLWKRYVSKVANRYGTRIDYQVWPEPNIIQNWRGTPAEMAKLTMVASKAITKHAGKKAKVVSPAVALRLPGQRQWTVKYFKQKVGGKRVHTYVDAIAIDPFPPEEGTPEYSYKIMRKVKKQLGRIGVRKPFWSNEINYGVAGAGQPSTVGYSIDQQQSYVIRTYALGAAAGMRRVYWMGWFHTNTLAVHLVDDSSLPLPPAKSYEVVRSWLNQTRFSGCATKKNGMWVCTAKKGTETRRLYWKTSGKTRIKTPSSTKRVENQEGDVVPRKGRRTIRVTYRPIMVASRR